MILSTANPVPATLWQFFRPVGWLAALFVLCLPLAAVSAEAVIDLARFDEPASSDELVGEAARLTRELGKRPKDAALHTRRGAVHFKLREFDKAIADFTTALKLDDKLDEAWFGRGMALGRNGQVDEGILDLGVYIHRHPTSSLAYTKRGVRYLWKGDLASAEKDFTRAIALDRRNAEAHDDLGVIHAQRGEYDQAEQHFLATVRSEPTYQKGYHNLALVYYITSRNDQALDIIDKALKLVPEARDSLLLKGSILEALGRHKEAKTLRDDAEFLPAGEKSSRMPIQ
ncbi:MAG: tetratricopeptide repeat protein [Pseudomonadota bacterium]